MITLEFTSGGDLVGWAISTFTWCPWDHVQFVVGELRLAAFPGRGVELIPPPRVARSLQLDVQAPESVLELALTQRGKPYDWSAILGIVAHRDWREDDSWICSELVAWAFEGAGYPLLRADHLNRITPRDLLLSPRLIDRPSVASKDVGVGGLSAARDLGPMPSRSSRPVLQP